MGLELDAFAGNAVKPEEDDARLKAAEAGAVMHDDEAVYELLKPLEKTKGIRPDVPGLGQRAIRFLAIAEANLGKRGAQRRLRSLLPTMPWLGDLYTALVDGRPGPGWAGRFPYFRSTELLPRRRMEEFIELLGRQDQMPPERFDKLVTRFARRFPLIVLLAEKLIWEDMQAEAGMAILMAVDTPASHAALRRFGLSQVGDDDLRLQALSMLSEAGQISSDEPLRIWLQGEWTERRLRQYEFIDEPEWAYSSQVVDLLNRGLMVLEDGDLRRAEQVFRQAPAPHSPPG